MHWKWYSLPRSADVNGLYEVECDGDGQDDGGEEWDDRDDEDDGAKEICEGTQPLQQREGSIVKLFCREKMENGIDPIVKHNCGHKDRP